MVPVGEVHELEVDFVGEAPLDICFRSPIDRSEHIRLNE